MMQDMPVKERLLSERYRLVADQWVAADAEAREFEELKTTRLEQYKTKLILEQGEMADNKAERIVKASKDWEDYLLDMVTARTKANYLKVQLTEIQILEREQQDRNQTIRAEMRMAR